MSYQDGEIYYSHATGDVHGTSIYIGGLLGHSNATIVECYATGNVYGEDDYVGGLIGLIGGGIVEVRIEDSYATGNVEGIDDIGGFAGLNRGMISRSYSLGRVVGEENTGGFVGRNEGTVEASYFSLGPETEVLSTCAKGRFEEQLKAGTPNDFLNRYGDWDDTGDILYLNWDTEIWDFGSAEEYPQHNSRD